MCKTDHLPRRAAALILALALALSCAGCGGSGAAAPTAAPAAPDAAVQDDAPVQAEPTAAPAQPVDADIYVEAIEGLPEDFIRGADISSLPAELASGVRFRDADGQEIADAAAFCQLLAQAGLTHVRVRVWNDPYDADGHGYGGGNNDVDTAAELAAACVNAGLKMLVDFHLSDFWADPSKQMAPKAWEGLDAAARAEAAGSFIAEALGEIEAAAPGVVDMVQVGNETNNAVAGVSDVDGMCAIFEAGCQAVHEFGQGVGREVRAVIHLTDPNKGTMSSWAQTLSSHEVEYDILATSYYPTYHGSLEELTAELARVREDFGKDVLVAETSYAYTTTDTDSGGTVTIEGGDLNWPFTVQGQATYLREAMAAANAGGALGLFYWEPAWITVGDTTGLEGDALKDRLDANSALWEEYGSGWASSYAGDYDPDDAGVWYGGSAMDNQALFAPDGAPLPSLQVWNYVYTGAVTDSVTVEAIPDISVTLTVGGEAALPQTVTVAYNTGLVEEPVVWDAEALAGIDMSAAGEYQIPGVVSLSRTPDDGEAERQTTATVTVEQGNLLPAEAAGFESGDGYVVEGEGISAIPAADDPYEGEGSLHWWSESEAVTGTATYTGPVHLAAGSYTLTAQAQGLEGDTVALAVLDADGNELAVGEPATLAGWTNWQQPTVSFTLDADADVQLRVIVNMQAGGWGTCDALTLN